MINASPLGDGLAYAADLAIETAASKYQADGLSASDAYALAAVTVIAAAYASQLSVNKVIKIVNAKGIGGKVNEGEAPGGNPIKIDLSDASTWPKPPAQGKLTEGIPSRNKPALRGEKSLYDENGGEWRYFPGDAYHNPHWDYKPSGNNQEWQNIPIGNLSPLK